MGCVSVETLPQKHTRPMDAQNEQRKLKNEMREERVQEVTLLMKFWAQEMKICLTIARCPYLMF